MSEQETRVFSEDLHRGFAQGREYRSLTLERDPGPPVLLREVVAGGGFGRTVSCAPGRLVVLLAAESGLFEPFRRALTGKTGERPGIGEVTVQMRYGAHPLDPSEIHLAGSVDHFWKQTTLRGILKSAGVPDAVTPALVELLELESSLQRSPAELGSGAIHRLAIACSFFTRSRLLVYDAPFANIEPAWVDKLAALLLDGTREGMRIAVVSGVQTVPEAWRTSPHVDVYGAPEQARPQSDVATRIRDLVHDRRGNDERAVPLVTRPQRIPGRTKSAYEQLGAEVIRNPHADEALEDAAGERLSAKAAPARKRNEVEGKLTKVTNVYRMTHRPWALKLRSLFRGKGK